MPQRLFSAAALFFREGGTVECRSQCGLWSGVRAAGRGNGTGLGGAVGLPGGRMGAASSRILRTGPPFIGWCRQSGPPLFQGGGVDGGLISGRRWFSRGMERGRRLMRVGPRHEFGRPRARHCRRFPSVSGARGSRGRGSRGCRKRFSACGAVSLRVGSFHVAAGGGFRFPGEVPQLAGCFFGSAGSSFRVPGAW